jgi:carboxylate-amine ligase
MDHKFRGDPYTIGIEEELMILDADSLELVNAIESMLEPAPAVGEIKPELMESVLEVSTDPCRNTAEAGEQLRALRAQVSSGRSRGTASPRPTRTGRTTSVESSSWSTLA